MSFKISSVGKCNWLTKEPQKCNSVNNYGTSLLCKERCVVLRKSPGWTRPESCPPELDLSQVGVFLMSLLIQALIFEVLEIIKIRSKEEIFNIIMPLENVNKNYKEIILHITRMAIIKKIKNCWQGYSNPHILLVGM